MSRSTGIYKKDEDGNFVEIGEYAPELMEYIPDGHHYIMKQKGSRAVRLYVDPAFMPVLAAMKQVGGLTDILYDAYKAHPSLRDPLTPKQQKLWKKFQDEVDIHGITYPSTHDVLEKFMEAISDVIIKMEAENLALKELREQYTMVLNMVSEK